MDYLFIICMTILSFGLFAFVSALAGIENRKILLIAIIGGILALVITIFFNPGRIII